MSSYVPIWVNCTDQCRKNGENDSSEHSKHKCSSTLCNNQQLNQFRFSTMLASLRLPPLLAFFCRYGQVQVVYPSRVLTGLAFIADQEACCEKMNASSALMILRKICSSSTQRNYCILICKSLVLTVIRFDGGCVELGYTGVCKWHGLPFDSCRHQSYNSGQCRFEFVWIRLTWP